MKRDGKRESERKRKDKNQRKRRERVEERAEREREEKNVHSKKKKYMQMEEFERRKMKTELSSIIWILHQVRPWTLGQKHWYMFDRHQSVSTTISHAADNH